MKRPSSILVRSTDSPCLCWCVCLHTQHCLLPKTGAFYEAGKILRETGIKALVDITFAFPKESPISENPYDVLVSEGGGGGGAPFV
jgi:hypothetical protein